MYNNVGNNDIGKAALSAAATLRQLGPGPLAELRQMRAGVGAPVFWRLASRHPGTIGRSDREREWMAIVRSLAILTPREGIQLHNGARRLGAVLCDGGNPGWPGNAERPYPALSERRLALLMRTHGAQHTALFERAARSLSRTIVPGSGVNVPDIAYVMLLPEKYGPFLARAYYRRLDRAEWKVETASEEAPA